MINYEAQFQSGNFVEKERLRMNQEEILYEEVVEEVTETIDTFVQLKINFSRAAIDLDNFLPGAKLESEDFKYIINSRSFYFKKSLEFSLEMLEKQRNQIKKVFFLNIGKPSVNILQIFFSRIRNLPRFNGIGFINISLNATHMKMVKDLLFWH